MTAVVFDRPNEFVVRTVPTPRPTPGHVLVRVAASMVCATDRKILAGTFAGTNFPHVPGHEFSGEVVALGRGVVAPPIGMRVGVEVHVGCGTCDRCREGLYTLCLNYGKPETGHAHIGFTIPGGLAQYVSVPAAAIHVLPDNITLEEGAWTDNLGVALWALERGRLVKGERVVVVGPGAIGLCAAQLARALGAREVVVVGRGERLERAKAFADRVVEDATALFGTFDLVVEFAGTAGAAPAGSRRPRRRDRSGRRAFGARSLDDRARTPRHPRLGCESEARVGSSARAARRREGRRPLAHHAAVPAYTLRGRVGHVHRAPRRRDPRDAAATGAVMDTTTALNLYRVMRAIRRFEQRSTTLFGENKIWGTIHSYAGEEAIAAGVCEHLRDDDWITSTHRGHGHCIAKRADLGRMFAELLGRETGYCRGRGGSMHIADTSKGNLGANGIVGGGIPIATGAALTAKQLGTDQVAVSFFGDGAANQGTFHESLNIAAIWKLPVIYVCENNQYAESFPARKAFAIEDIAIRAAGYGMPGVRVDGRDVAKVYDAAGEAIARARAGGGPTLLVCESYRHEGHYYGDPRRYQTKEEIEGWRTAFDPLTDARAWIVREKLGTEAELDAIDRSVDEAMEEAVAWAEAGPPASPLTPEEIYATH
jgi:pyruvate dehydrogenase E1 component alpha subunit